MIDIMDDKYDLSKADSSWKLKLKESSSFAHYVEHGKESRGARILKNDKIKEDIIGPDGLEIAERIFNILKEINLEPDGDFVYYLDPSYSSLISIVTHMVKSNILDLLLEAPDSALFWIYKMVHSDFSIPNETLYFYMKAYSLAGYPETFIATGRLNVFRKFYKINNLPKNSLNNKVSANFQKSIINPFKSAYLPKNDKEIIFSAFILLLKVYKEDLILEILERMETELPNGQMSELLFLLQNWRSMKAEPLAWSLETSDWPQRDLFPRD